MANYAAGTATGPGAAAAFLAQISAHLVTNGWTVYDTISAGTDYVFRGGALDATADNRPFIRITQTATTNFNLFCYADWDVTTHTGIAVAGAGGSTVITLQDATFAWFLWANAVALCICLKTGGYYYRTYLGFCRRGLSPVRGGVTKTTGSNAIGVTSLAVASDMTSKLQVGQRIQIMNYAHASGNANAAHCETVTISSISSTTIGISALVAAYDAGALVGQNPHPIVVANAAAAAGPLPCITLYMPYDTTGSRTSATGQLAAVKNLVMGEEGSEDPSDDSAEYAPGVMVVNENTAGKQGKRGYMYGWCACAGGSQAAEDIGNDGTNTYILLSLDTTGACLMGPQ